MIQEDSAGNLHNPAEIYKCVRKVEIRLSVLDKYLKSVQDTQKKHDVSRHIRFCSHDQKEKMSIFILS